LQRLLGVTQGTVSHRLPEKKKLYGFGLGNRGVFLGKRTTKNPLRKRKCGKKKKGGPGNLKVGGGPVRRARSQRSTKDLREAFDEERNRVGLVVWWPKYCKKGEKKEEISAKGGVFEKRVERQ